MHIRGDLSLRNFKPGDFNLVGTGSLLVVKETSRLSSLSLYGNLFMETGKGGLRFTGEIENSTLRGSVIISNSNLVFPPTEANIREESQLSIPLAFVDDTTKVHPTVSHTALSDFFGEDSSAERTPGSSENIGTKSFLDGVHYDLDVETIGGNTQIKMIFNAITNEELVANIEGRLNITGDETQWLGNLTVSRAYCEFLPEIQRRRHLAVSWKHDESGTRPRSNVSGATGGYLGEGNGEYYRNVQDHRY